MGPKSTGCPSVPSVSSSASSLVGSSAFSALRRFVRSSSPDAEALAAGVQHRGGAEPGHVAPSEGLGDAEHHRLLALGRTTPDVRRYVPTPAGVEEELRTVSGGRKGRRTKERMVVNQWISEV